MGALDRFSERAQKPTAPGKPGGMPWEASVACQFCGEEVDEQVYYPTESLLTWQCSQGHRSFIEGFRVAF